MSIKSDSTLLTFAIVGGIGFLVAAVVSYINGDKSEAIDRGIGAAGLFAAVLYLSAKKPKTL